MQIKKLFLGSVFLTAAMIAPMAITASAAPQAVSVRIYDRDHKDYHNWDDREDRSYQLFHADHPKYKVTYRKANRRQQREYWTWRHEHPDHD
jgi:hypothetical protein